MTFEISDQVFELHFTARADFVNCIMRNINWISKFKCLQAGSDFKNTMEFSKPFVCGNNFLNKNVKALVL